MTTTNDTLKALQVCTVEAVEGCHCAPSVRWFNCRCPDAMVTTYTYDPLVGMTSETGPDGRTIYYEYDSFGRLEYSRNHLGEIITKHQYHYAGQ